MAIPRQQVLLRAGLLVLLAWPWLSQWVGSEYLTTVMSRVLIFAIAAVSLDLIVGYGAMVSFGHAAFVGLGAYVTAISAYHYAGSLPLLAGFAGSNALWVNLPLAMAVAGLAALLTGLICLRTQGIHFIMITLAFAQMLYYLFVSLDFYGGEDGLVMPGRNELPLVDTTDDRQFYYLCLGLLLGYLYLARRLVDSRFGRVLRGSRINETRLRALGFNSYGYRLVAYVIAATGGALAGALLANQTEFVDPGLFSWQLSGELLVMVILGGLGSLYGAVIGAIVFLMLEQWLSAWTEHWMFFLGPFLILVVVRARHGLLGLLSTRSEA
jgi:branched-chain amino acid transport system permease protein